MPRFKIDGIQPLSVNQVWAGRRFKTKVYKDYEALMLKLLPAIELPAPPYKVVFEFGFSNKASDIDNPIKPILDIMQEKYPFNDKLIDMLVVYKKIVPKGKQYILFQITTYEAGV